MTDAIAMRDQAAYSLATIAKFKPLSVNVYDKVDLA